ncbi:paraslipin [Accumulibacter sp.]|uniref:SPFH domain-containing protein n=1 Tax=Accumulibacter sp. TaxID=2053492 RepID=UPI002582B400|nr:paraslipin [Accumulibacter sp.]
MTGMTIFSIVFLIFVAVTVANGVRIVPQGEEWIVQRLGKYHSTLLPGLRFIIPYIDIVSYKVTTKDIILDVQEQEVITRDNAVIVVNAIAFIKVTDPVKAVYGVQDYSEAIRNMIMTTLRSIVGEMELDQALSSRDTIKARLKAGVADEALDWGLTVKSVEIQDIKPSQSMQRASMGTLLYRRLSANLLTSLTMISAGSAQHFRSHPFLGDWVLARRIDVKIMSWSTCSPVNP